MVKIPGGPDPRRALMMTVARICQREVDVATPRESVQVAAQRMLQRRVGTLVVVDPSGRPAGIVTDRDLVLRVVSKGLDPRATPVAEAMSTDLQSATESTSIPDAVELMKRAGVRRLPVVDAKGKLLGLVSLDDVLATVSDQFSRIGELLRAQNPSALARERS